jgi:hypothetical protein
MSGICAIYKENGGNEEIEGRKRAGTKKRGR